MKNRSAILAAMLLFAGTTAFAQKGEISSAKTAYEAYDGLRNTKALAYPQLDKAKASIDKATANEKTSADPEAWAYRALIYAGYADKDTTEASYGAAANEAVAAIKKATELDTKGAFKDQLKKANENLYRIFLTKAVGEYKKGAYSTSYNTFNTAATFRPAGEDTTAVYYAAISAQNAKDFPNAIKKYNSLLTSNFSFLQDVYSNLSILYANQKDTVSAIKIAGEGAKRFPANTQLAQREIEFSLMTHKEKETIDKITAQAAKDPTNKFLPYYLGIAYAATKDLPKAEEAYKKALEIDPNYANAMINLSGLIMNNGIDLYRVANSFPASKQAEYAAGMKKANAEFDRAFPFLEKATQLDPKSELAWKNLRAYYNIKDNTAKVAEINKKIEEL